MFKRKKIKYVNPNQEKISSYYRKNEKQKKRKKSKLWGFIETVLEFFGN